MRTSLRLDLSCDTLCACGSIFRPELTWWRLVLMARKLAIAVVAIMFSTHAMFQASLSVGIIFVSYITHIHYKPFLDSLQIRGGQLTTGTPYT